MSPLQIKLAVAILALLLLFGFGRAVWQGQQHRAATKALTATKDSHAARLLTDEQAQRAADDSIMFYKGRVYELQIQRHLQSLPTHAPTPFAVLPSTPGRQAAR